MLSSFLYHAGGKMHFLTFSVFLSFPFPAELPPPATTSDIPILFFHNLIILNILAASAALFAPIFCARGAAVASL